MDSSLCFSKKMFKRDPMNTENSIDRNFDDLAHKFKRKVYGGLKGDIRLAVLKQDLSQFCKKALNPAKKAPLNILDAGGGYGPFSLQLAQLGHKIVLCDISQKMLEKAILDCKEKNISANVKILHNSIQKMDSSHHQKYDLVLCHAVLEWVQDPEKIISHLLTFLKPNGLLSLTFYNLNGMIFKNMLRVNYKKIIKEDYKGWPGSLTPAHPLLPEHVLSWLEIYKTKVLCHSGMRVFHDYILDLTDKDKHPETLLKLELKFSRQMPFRDLGRYQHIIAKKN